ncbi:MAG TPA: 1-acyl-sn-glycerol-3-phosphate acyltransferase [Prolixibacteraceae bacterium]
MIQRSKGYEALRDYVRFAFWLTHKRIVVNGCGNIPGDKPIIFAANHQNALMDPLALVCTNPLQTLWLARADIFKSKASRAFLNFCKMIPIYRIRDGKENLSNNEEIFNQVTHVLEEKGSVALFPEAAHSGKRQMLPHKKAIPRIALESEMKNNFQLGLQIVPVGIYYDHYWNFNRTLLVNYGEPIEIDSYKVHFAENPQNAMLLLRDEINQKLLPLTMQINNVDAYQDYENIRTIAGKACSKNKFFSKDPVIQLFKTEQELIAKLERLEELQPEKFGTIKQLMNNYLTAIKKAGVTDDQLDKAANTSFLKFLMQFFVSVFFLPIAAFGILFNVFPYFFPRIFFAGKVKDLAFMGTFIFASGLVLFPLIYLLESGIIWFTTGSFPIAAVSLLAMPFAGKIAFNLLQMYQNLFQHVKIRYIFTNQFKHCKNLRSEVIRIISSY